MVTKRELQEDDALRARLAKEQAQKQAQSSEEWRKEREARDRKRAKDLLNGELGEAIKRWNAAGHKRVKLQENSAWKADGGEIYSEPFKLGFEPRLQYEPTSILCKHLHEAGFAAFVEKVTERNRDCVSTADGYEFVDAPGWHDRDYLVIDWS
jgi:hypothetical protein